MAKLTESKYVPPVEANPFLDAVKVYTDKGIDTPFDVEFTAAEYRSEKLLIQKAARELGFSVREVVTTWDDELSGKAPVKSTFVVRPARKRKSGETEGTEAVAE